jgi:hypothetical protein
MGQRMVKRGRELRLRKSLRMGREKRVAEWSVSLGRSV